MYYFFVAESFLYVLLPIKYLYCIVHYVSPFTVCWIIYLALGKYKELSNSYTMGCPPVSGDNPRDSASGLSYVHVDTHVITIFYHIHQCRPCTSRDISSSW